MTRGRIRLDACMMMGVSIVMGMHHALMMHMGDGRDVIVAGQTVRSRVMTGQCQRDRRNKHAKQISQGDKPPCPLPLRPGKSNQHQYVNTFDPSFPDS
jgi:hypothetical protein